jgi:hypothetical protein
MGWDDAGLGGVFADGLEIGSCGHAATLTAPTPREPTQEASPCDAPMDRNRPGVQQQDAWLQRLAGPLAMLRSRLSAPAQQHGVTYRSCRCAAVPHWRLIPASGVAKAAPALARQGACPYASPMATSCCATSARERRGRSCCLCVRSAAGAGLPTPRAPSTCGGWARRWCREACFPSSSGGTRAAGGRATRAVVRGDGFCADGDRGRWPASARRRWTRRRWVHASAG